MEQAFLKWLRSRNRTRSNREFSNLDRVLLGIGDDAAVFGGTEDPWVVACDSIAQDTHFDLNEHSLGDVGRKAIAVNLSDMAAMAAIPQVATLSFQIPKVFSLAQVKEIFLGAEEFAESFDVQIIGGDTNTWPGGLVVGANVIGQTGHSVWRMDGGQPGDDIVVSGEFGGSILGHHLSFIPRCRLATKIAQHHTINAATDVSDSLALDLSDLATASGCGAELELAKIPLSKAATRLAEQNENENTALEHALYDGEDFELILAVPPSSTGILMQDNYVNRELTVIGRLTPQPGLFGIDTEGRSQPIQVKGYRH